jgi:hypothetical protein
VVKDEEIANSVARESPTVAISIHPFVVFIKQTTQVVPDRPDSIEALSCKSYCANFDKF